MCHCGFVGVVFGRCFGVDEVCCDVVDVDFGCLFEREGACELQ